MTLLFRATDKEVLNDRNKIFLLNVLPTLNRKGFLQSPFSTSWYGRNNLHDFSYELCRLSNENKYIELIYISRGDNWIKVYLNIFKLDQPISSLKLFEDIDALILILPPYNLTNMRLRIDDYKGIPLFRTKEYKLNLYFSKNVYEKSLFKLGELIQSDMDKIDLFIEKWYSIYKTPKTIQINFLTKKIE
jgi:hypothetical protein